MIPNERFISGMHEWQRDVLEIFDEREARFFILEWHRRARKTSLALNLLIKECVKNPHRSYSYIAPERTQARRIVWDEPEMLQMWLPDKDEIGWITNETNLNVKFANGSILHILGADKPDAIRGAKAYGTVLDEFQLMKPEAWYEVVQPIAREAREHWAMFLFTPCGLNHATDLFDMAKSGEKEFKDWYAQRLKASESHVIPADQLEAARKTMPPTLYAQEFECEHITDEDRIFITTKLMEALRGVKRLFSEKKRIISCDPSLGGDECVVYAIENGRIIDELFLHEKNASILLGQIVLFGSKHKIRDYIIDCIGFESMAAQLRELGNNVISFNSSEKAVETDKYYNKRVEAYWHTMLEMRKKNVAYPEDFELRKQLSNVRYKVINSNGQVMLEPKDEVRKRIKRSPDRADAYTMGIWGLQYVDAYKVVGKWDDVFKTENRNLVHSFMAG